ncbi:MAG: hypothetical protein K6U08_09350, partial [Firmicutes bacterium]|nr:hypothetical protein [Bacillota bacterium]
DHDYFYTLQEICVLLNLLPNTFRQIAREYSDLVVLREQVRKGRPVVGLPRPDFEALRLIVDLRGRGLAPDEIRRVVQAAGHAGRERPEEEGPPSTLLTGDASAEDALERSDGAPERSQPRTVPPTERCKAHGRPCLYGEIRTPGEDPARLGLVPVETAAASSPAADRSSVPSELPSLTPPEDSTPMEEDLSPPPLPGEEPAPTSPTELALLREIAALREELHRMDQSRQEERDRLITALMRTQHELQSLRYELGVSLSRRERKRKKSFWAWLLDL